ncbi:Uncharacterised protein [Mycobacteroides abscessus subsp. abscessus]|nr:hypothetical protein [Mycobacteroides abscessus]SIJ25377.1 Uncharacterised protein [Mycobacteroides abscessus subsp. abscessus]SIJ69797.1 Uncharacterised protein [Mycobacteroides abscessus subsp. abscessus]SIL92754.1 Uncharacterised protein [Mycobacteroides abscessus subsp. abscessus]SLE64139.1 Uncharacterised protein [Mycobacteroides abscessus subsp. abscessus]SLH43977.1 Uncharacterised protein [Mycobacteroides abscessus subsp. abscessus]
MIKHLTRRATVALVVAAAAISPAAYPAMADTATPLNGLFALTPGSCAEGRATGSYFRMILPAGDASGPYLANGDSSDSISADLSAWAASWNRQEFNQGAPKPKAKEQAQIPGEARAKQVWEFVAGRWVGHDSVDGESPKATGTYDKDTKKFTLDWTSLIVGGPFNSFTGVWHLEGVVRDR